jgi:hypothetical protein
MTQITQIKTRKIVIVSASICVICGEKTGVQVFDRSAFSGWSFMYVSERHSHSNGPKRKYWSQRGHAARSSAHTATTMNA